MSSREGYSGWDSDTPPLTEPVGTVHGMDGSIGIEGQGDMQPLATTLSPLELEVMRQNPNHATYLDN